MSHIFISHVEEDKDVVALLAQELEAAGYQTWHYTRDSLPGSSYLVQTERAIEQSQAVVVVISQHTLQAPLQITPEIVRAYEGGKPIIPVLRDLTHEALQQQPEWRQAMAATVSLPIPHAGVAAMMPRLLRGLQNLGLQPQRPSQVGRPPSATVQQPGPLATMLRALRQGLARYWRRLVSWLTVIFVLLNILKALELEGVQVPGVTGRPWPIGLGLGLLILVRFPRLARLLTRLILGPPQAPTALPTLFRGPRPYGQEDVLPGRQKECDDCWQQLRSAPFFILEGESGCGKSSLLNAALLPRARQVFQVVLCRLADDPLGKLCAALRQEPYRPSPTPLALTALAEALAYANAAARPKPLLLCIDQAEELFVTVRDEVREQCLTVLKDAIAAAQLRLLITIRSDFRDLLDRLCRSLDPQQQTLDLGSYYTLQALHAGPARAVLDEILRPASGQDALLRQQLDDFAGALVADLLRPPRDPRLCQDDEKTVLPVELQTVGMMLESVGLQQVSVAGLRRQGGKAGLMRAYIEGAKTYAWHKTGVPPDQTVLILRQLISPARTKWAQTASAIGQALGTPAAPVAQVLDAFAEKYLVNRLPAELADGNGADRPTAQRYELMHEYLVQILAEAPDPALQKAQDAEERLRFWLQRTRAVLAPEVARAPRRRLAGVRALLAKPIPLVESLRLWRYARRGDERRMLWRNLRGFGVRLGLVIVLLSPGWGYLSMELVRRARDMGALVVHNPLRATLTLRCIRHYQNESMFPRRATSQRVICLCRRPGRLCADSPGWYGGAGALSGLYPGLWASRRGDRRAPPRTPAGGHGVHPGWCLSHGGQGCHRWYGRARGGASARR